MVKNKLLWIFSIIFLTSSGLAEAQEFRPHHLLIKAKPGADRNVVERQLKRYGAQTVGNIPQIGVQIVSLPETANEQAVAALISKNKHFAFAELDVAHFPVDVIPNDPRFLDAWHLPKIAAPAAWDHGFGEGIIIAILDTGVFTAHPDLADNIYPLSFNSVDLSSDVTDVHGHGSLTAGTAAAVINNDIGVASVAGKAKIMPIKISMRSDGVAYSSDIARGITFAADNGADVASISYGVCGYSSINTASNYFRSKGGNVVIAAGNSGALEPYASHNTILCVSATTSADSRASWSSYGEFVDISAPGVGILTTNKSGGYSAVSGTSFSTPITAGVVALMKSVNPALTPSQIDNSILASSQDLGTQGYDIYFGHGRVDANAAVLAAINTDASDGQAPSVSIVTPANNEEVNGMVSVEVSATDNIGVTYVDLFVNGSYFARSTTPPYSFIWDSSSVADGLSSFEARAYDEASNQGRSATIQVDVNNLQEDDFESPVVYITQPGDGDAVSGRVRIEASAVDNVAVTSMRLFINNIVVSETSGASLSYMWQTKKESPGNYLIKVEAQDQAGNVGVYQVSVTLSSDGGSGGGGGPGKGNGKGPNKS